jgi:hypothetical protein
MDVMVVMASIKWIGNMNRRIAMKRNLIVGLITLAIAFIAIGLWSTNQQNRTTMSANPIADQSARNATPPATHNHAAINRVPAHYDIAPSPDTLRGTLAPELFTGNVQLAYRAAKEIPQTLAQLPCYCHCDMSKGHKSLHSCFEDQHGENCGICIGEAVMAYNLERQGLRPAQIRERIIQAYGSGRSD